MGCVLPVLPGPPISYLALLLIHFTGTAELSTVWLATFGVLALAMTVVDYVVPVYATKKFGGSKSGAWGAGIGLAVGLFVPFVGIFVGTFLGALLGELYQGNDFDRAIKAAVGSCIGILTGTLGKLVVSLAISVYFVICLI